MRGVSVAVLDKNVPDDEGGVRYWQCDVGDAEAVSKVAAEVETELGTVTVLINNAAVVRGKTLLETTTKDVTE